MLGSVVHAWRLVAAVVVMAATAIDGTATPSFSTGGGSSAPHPEPVARRQAA
jgi:hypothetical protein